MDEKDCVHCERLKEYMIALEHSRSDLWGVNEELRLKVLALEKGQEELLEKLSQKGTTPTPP